MYQPMCYGHSVEEDMSLGRQCCDTIMVTGEGTSLETPVEKAEQFQRIAEDFPLIIGAGMTLDRLRESLMLCDGFIVGSWFKEDHSARGEVCEEYNSKKTLE